MHTGIARYFRAVALLGLVASVPTCDSLGDASGSQGALVPAQYTGLAGKSVAIVVYVQPATINEYAGAREEIATFVAIQMRAHLPTARLLNPQDVINWQNSTINWYGLSERDIGKHFSVDRVLYIEVLDYSTKRSLGYSDMQGHLRARCKIIETDSDVSQGAWSAVVDATWPADRPLDPTQINESALRLRTLETFADKMVRLLYDHHEHDESMRIRG